MRKVSVRRKLKYIWRKREKLPRGNLETNARKRKESKTGEAKRKKKEKKYVNI